MSPTTLTQHCERQTLPYPATALRIPANDHGYLDASQFRSVVDRFLEISMDAECGDVVIDLSHLKYTTAHFLNVLVCFWRSLRLQKRRLVLCGVQPHCAYILRLGGVDRLIPCFAAPHGRANDKGDRDPAGLGEFAYQTAHDHEWRVVLDSA